MEKENHVLTLLLENKKHSQNVEKGIKVDRSNKIKTEAKVIKEANDSFLKIKGARLLTDDEAEKFREQLINIDSYSNYEDTDFFWLMPSNPQGDDSAPIANYYDGEIDSEYVDGDNDWYIRPVLEISGLKEAGYNIGDDFKFVDEPFTIISDNLALCDYDIGHLNYRDDYDYDDHDGDDYNKSDIKAKINRWFNKRIKKFNDNITNLAKYSNEVYYWNGKDKVPKQVFNVVIEDGVTEIGKEAFEHCFSLQSVVIPDSITDIGDSAFSRCFSLKSINIPNSVTEIGEYAFSSCDSLKSIIIPNGVTKINDRAFAFCDNLRSITIPDSVTDINDYAFQDDDLVVYTNNKYAQEYCKQEDIPWEPLK